MAGTTGIVQGKNCVFQVNFGEGYKTLVCAKSFGVTITTTLKETTSRGSGVHEEYDYDSLSYRISLSGLIKAVDLDDDPIFFDLADYQKGFLPVEFRAIFTDNNAVVKRFRGTAIIQTSAFNASAGQLADSTVDMQGTGEYFIDNDSGGGCTNSVSSIVLNGLTLSNGANVVITYAADLNITIISLANDEVEIFKYDWEIDSNGRNSVYTDGSLPYTFPTFDMDDITVGDHVLTIYPVCTDTGIDGGTFTVNIHRNGEIPP